MIRFLTFSIILHFTIFSVNAQTVEPTLLTAAGDSFQNGNVHLDWSLGELMTETISDANTVLTQGLHQTEMELITSIEDNLISISIYPNPASEFISFQTEYHKYPRLKTIIHDGMGKILMESTINGREDLLDISALKEGVYYLRIYGNGTVLNSSKLIKK